MNSVILGAGGELIDLKVLVHRRPDEITENAGAFLMAVLETGKPGGRQGRVSLRPKQQCPARILHQSL